MLKFTMYINVLLILIISISFLKRILKKNIDLRFIKKFVILYMFYNIVNLFLIESDLVDIGWILMLLILISINSFIINIISIVNINKRIQPLNNINCNKFNNSKKKFLILMPIILFIIPYLYELYILNNCTYLLKYNYQNGIVQSNDTYIAIINNRPIKITLQKNIFNRNGVKSNKINYDIIYNNSDIELLTYDSIYNKIAIENKKIEKIAIDAKKRCPVAKGGFLYYFSEGDFSIITLTSEKTSGQQLGEYFYYKNKYIKNITTFGDFESIIYYK